MLASNPGFPFRILSHSFGEISEGKPGRISHVIQWHRDVNLSSANATRHTECASCCVSAEGKDARKQVQGDRVIPGAWALCSPSVATAADWIF